MFIVQLLIIVIILASFVYYLKKFFKGGVYLGPKQSLTGKNAIVTGGFGGIGSQIVTDLAKQGCKVIIADIVNSERILSRINKTCENQNVSYLRLDLGDLESIKQFVNKVSFDKIDYLVCNAAIMGKFHLETTKSKFESHNGINYVGHYYLTHLLWPKLNKSDYFRIVNLSSRAHIQLNCFGKPVDLQVDNINFEKGDYNRDIAYARSKLYVTMFTKHLASIIDPSKGIVVCAYPGFVRTEIISNYLTTIMMIIIMYIGYPFYYLASKSCLQGAQTILHCLYSNPKQLKSGSYYADCTETPQNPLVIPHAKSMFQSTQNILGINFGN